MAVRKETLMCYPQIYTQYHKEMKVPNTWNQACILLLHKRNSIEYLLQPIKYVKYYYSHDHLEI